MSKLTSVIKCIDCGDEREIYKSNVGRVLRCKECQYDAARRRNTAYVRERRAVRRATSKISR